MKASDEGRDEIDGALQHGDRQSRRKSSKAEIGQLEQRFALLRVQQRQDLTHGGLAPSLAIATRRGPGGSLTILSSVNRTCLQSVKTILGVLRRNAAGEKLRVFA